MKDDLILVVEDDPGQREQLAGFLDSLGVKTRQAGDAETALEVLSAERVDLVITDLRLPGESGIDLLRKARERDTDVNFIVVTAHGSVEAWAR